MSVSGTSFSAVCGFCGSDSWEPLAVGSTVLIRCERCAAKARIESSDSVVKIEWRKRKYGEPWETVEEMDPAERWLWSQINK